MFSSSVDLASATCVVDDPTVAPDDMGVDVNGDGTQPPPSIAHEPPARLGLMNEAMRS